MERKRIILLATSDINYDQRVLKIANSLHDLGAEVFVLGRELPSSIPLVHRPFNQDRVKCVFNKGVLFYFEITLRFFWHLLFNTYDVVCANDPDTLLAVLKAKAFKKLDYVYDSHEYFTEVPELQGKKIKRKIWAIIEKRGVHKALECYTVNDSLAHIFKDKFAKDFKVIRNVPMLQDGIASKQEGNYLLYQGALNKGRGLVELIHAMSSLSIHLKIAGKGDLEGELKRLSKELGLEHRVEFVGNLLPKDLQLLTNNAWLGLNLLESTSLNYYYSLANKFFDYMHADVPSLNMNFPEYETILSDWPVGKTINQLDAESIANALKDLQTDEKDYNRLKNNCLKAKQAFNWQKESVQLRAIYRL